MSKLFANYTADRQEEKQFSDENLILSPYFRFISTTTQLVEHQIRVAREVRANAKGAGWLMHTRSWRVDMFVRELNADTAESILGWTHFDCIGPIGTLSFDF